VVTPPTARVGQGYGFGVTVRNAGRFSADDVTVSGSVSGSASDAGEGDWAAESGCSGPAGGFTCAIGSLDPGRAWTLSLDYTAAHVGTATVSIAAAASTDDANAADNAASGAVTILAAVRCVVPRVVGKTLTAARSAIVRGKCTVGRLTRAFSTRAKGRVVRQQPAAGARRVQGARVALVLSKGRRR
jgi:hypothetical protein